MNETSKEAMEISALKHQVRVAYEAMTHECRDYAKNLNAKDAAIALLRAEVEAWRAWMNYLPCDCQDEPGCPVRQAWKRVEDARAAVNAAGLLEGTTHGNV